MKQVELFETAEYLALDDLKLQIVNDGILKRQEFLKYTNVRRHYLDNLGNSEGALELIFEGLNPELLLFTLTDPALDVIEGLEYQCRYLFEDQYAEFTRSRIEFIEKMKDDD